MIVEFLYVASQTVWY